MSLNLWLLVFEFGTCLGISAGVLFILRPALEGLLVDLCGKETSSRFWISFTQLMIFIAPLMTVLWMSVNVRIPADLIYAARETLMHALFGQFVGLAIIGMIVLKFSARDQRMRAAALERADTAAS
ncbi:MAG: hypothetical protein ACPGO3_04410 [Magnetospiraceae bacterium]